MLVFLMAMMATELATIGIADLRADNIQIGADKTFALNVGTILNVNGIGNDMTITEIRGSAGNLPGQPNKQTVVSDLPDVIRTSYDGQFAYRETATGSSYTRDYGLTWQAYSAEIARIIGLSSSGEFVFARGQGENYFRSKDYGVSFIPMVVPTNYNCNKIVESQQKLYMLAHSPELERNRSIQVLASLNLGQTWKIIFTIVDEIDVYPFGFPSGPIYYNLACDSTGQFVYVSYFAEKFNIFYISNNFGVTFNQSPYQKKFQTLFAAKNQVYGNIQEVFGPTDIVVSDDYGKTFTSRTKADYVIFSVIYQHLATTNFVNIEVSNDAGLTWSQIPIVGYPTITPLGNMIYVNTFASEIQRYSIPVKTSFMVPIVDNDVSLGSPTARYTNGYFSEAVYANGIQLTSDERFKTDIETITSTKISQLRPVKYKMDGKAHFGLLAQELQKIYPELVEGEDRLSIDMPSLIALLIKEVQELRELIS